MTAEIGKNYKRVDLHLHSFYSDGVLSPEQLVAAAEKAGLCAISLTDHDTVGGIGEAVQHGDTLGVEVIPGVELSTTERGLDTHILGYFIDKDNTLLADHLEFFRQQRIKRAKKIVDKLNMLGCVLTFEEVKKKSASGSIGRPHIAQVLYDRGYVTSMNEAFWRYLGDNKSAFEPKYRISTLEAILMIKKAGGLSFLAHPGCEIPENLIIEFIKKGLNGIEVIHPKHSQREIEYYRGLVRQYTILESGGSDYHSSMGDQAEIGKYALPYSIVEKMKEYLEHLS